MFTLGIDTHDKVYALPCVWTGIMKSSGLVHAGDRRHGDVSLLCMLGTGSHEEYIVTDLRVALGVSRADFIGIGSKWSPWVPCFKDCLGEFTCSVSCFGGI